MATENNQLPPHSDDTEEELRRVNLALNAVFALNPSASAQHGLERRDVADRYLTSFQRCPVAWMVCDRLLAAGEAQQFFSAQTLHSKCRSDIWQLPPEALPGLRDSLVQHLTHHALTTPPRSALVTRLAMAVASLAVQMKWNTIITDVLHNLHQNPELAPVVLQLLKVLPEECASDRLILTDEVFRFNMRDHLCDMARSVLDFLLHSPATELVFQAIHTWIRYVPIRPNVLCVGNFLETCMQALSKPELFEVAVDVFVEILRMYPSHIETNTELVHRMIPLVMSLQRSLDASFQHEDYDSLRGFCRIVTEMGESYMSLVLNAQDLQQIALVELVLSCSSIPDREIACIPLPFWYRFVTGLEGMEPYVDRQDCIDRFTPVLMRLLSVCVTLLQYPLDVEQWMEDQMDDIRRDRLYVGETVEDCCRLLGGNVVLHHLGSRLKEECDAKRSWQAIEAPIYAIQWVFRYVPNDENETLPFVMKLITELPPNITLLKHTTCTTIGKYAFWLSTHSDQLQPLLPCLAHGLSLTHSSTAAAIAIKQLCDYSQLPMADSVMQLYQDLSTSTCQTVDLRDELHLLEGLCRAVSHRLNNSSSEEASNYFRLVVHPIVTRLGDAMTSPKQVSAEIERLTVVVRFLKTKRHDAQPTMEVLRICWPILVSVSNRYANDSMLMEKLCRLHKHAIRACGASQYAPMLDPLISTITRSFAQSHQSPFLYLASICITEFGRGSSYVPKLMELISALSSAAFSVLNGLLGFVAHPDVVEELFYLMGRVMSYCPEPLVASPLLKSLFHCAVVGLQLDHRDANRGILNFLETTILYGISLTTRSDLEKNRQLLELALADGQPVVQCLVRSLAGELPMYSMDRDNGSVVGILYNWQRLSPSSLQSWVGTSIQSLAPQRESMQFMRAITSNPTKADFSVAARAFRSACERHRKLGQTGQS